MIEGIKIIVCVLVGAIVITTIMAVWVKFVGVLFTYLGM